MDRYSTQNAVDCVDGYFMRKPGESAQSAFLRAKAESVMNIQKYVPTIEALTFEKFMQATCLKHSTFSEGNNHAKDLPK